PDSKGELYRNWRPEIQSPDDIWNEIVKATKLPGVTSAPKLQPIETRLVMLQTGMRAPMGIKVKGQGLKQIEAFGIQLEHVLKQVEGVKDEAVFADRIVGKPDRKSTRLNSSHVKISYAVFCLKKNIKQCEPTT